jgi:AcrR family transcriptional regulator
MAGRSSRTQKNEPEGRLARERVFDAAADLFYRKGIQAVGVDAIVKQAGVAKISMYRSFPSKDDLVVAYLEERSADFWGQWDDAFRQYEDDPHARLRAIMSYLAQRTTQPRYRGCPFLNFCCEFPEGSHPGRRPAETAKRELRQRFLRIAKALRAPRPKQLADSLLLMVEGAYGISQSLGGRDSPANAIVWAAQALVEAQLQLRKT